jgi:hypothetical protein
MHQRVKILYTKNESLCGREAVALPPLQWHLNGIVTLTAWDWVLLYEGP